MASSKLQQLINKAHLNARVREFKIDNIIATKNKAVFVGDSITEINDLLHFYPHYTVHNRGVSADTTIGLLTRMDESIFDIKPSVIVFLMGINDLNFYDSTVTALSERYDNIFSQIKTKLPNAAVIIQSVYPVNTHVSRHFHFIKDINNIISESNKNLQSLAEKYGYLYIDMWKILSSDNGLNPEYTQDGIHPNRKGFSVIAETLRPILASLPQIDACITDNLFQK